MGTFITGELVRGAQKLGKAVGQQLKDSASGAATAVSNNNHVNKNLRTAAVSASGPVRSVLRICGRAGVAGAAVDGVVGGAKAAKAFTEGKITEVEVAKHVGAEAGCGFITSASGTAGTVLVYAVTGSMGPLALAAGMGASVGSRVAYRKVVGETLPEDENDDGKSNVEETWEDIGPNS